MSPDGVSTDPDKLATIKTWPIPTSVKAVQKFLGFATFYRRFVKGFAGIAKPLHELTQGGGTKKKGRRTPKPSNFQWKEEQHAFTQLLDCLTSAPILAFADYSKPFQLHTDASSDGLGAVLYQESDGHKRVIAYASRCLSKSEKHYPAHKLEFLSLKWAITEKFHDYLFGHSFSAFTDNNPLTYVLSSAKLDATGHRSVTQRLPDTLPQW